MFKSEIVDLAKNGSFCNDMHFTLSEVNDLPKLNTAKKINLLNLSIISYYVFASKNPAYEVYLLHRLLHNPFKNNMHYSITKFILFH